VDIWYQCLMLVYILILIWDGKYYTLKRKLLMIKEEYSPYKIVHHPKVISDLKQGKDIVPIQVHFVPTNKCNQRCSFCAYRMRGYSSAETFVDQDEIPIKKALELIDSMAKIGVKAIQFTGGGEPLAHRGITEMLTSCINNNLNIAMVTNGMNLYGEAAKLLALYGSWVRISVDAGCRETYSKTRGTLESTYDKVISNIENFARMKSKNCILGVGFVVTKDNYREVYDCARTMKEIGVDNFRISAAFTTEGSSYFDDFRKDAHDRCQKVKSVLQDDKFTVFNLFDDRDEDLSCGGQDYDFCPMKSLVPYLGADQNLYTCCVQAYNKNGFIGSLENQTFEDLWNSDHRKEFYKKHNPRHICKIPCMFTKKNEIINYFIKPDAKHINYI
jgi:MoaA/NifB/PqqE/SkfB family radical SAM enzyme